MLLRKKKSNEELIKDVNDLARDKYASLVSTTLGKEERATKNSELNSEVLEALLEKYEDQEGTIKEILHDLEKDLNA